MSSYYFLYKFYDLAAKLQIIKELKDIVIGRAYII